MFRYEFFMVGVDEDEKIDFSLFESFAKSPLCHVDKVNENRVNITPACTSEVICYAIRKTVL